MLASPTPLLLLALADSLDSTRLLPRTNTVDTPEVATTTLPVSTRVPTTTDKLLATTRARLAALSPEITTVRRTATATTRLTVTRDLASTEDRRRRVTTASTTTTAMMVPSVTTTTRPLVATTMPLAPTTVMLHPVPMATRLLPTSDKLLLRVSNLSPTVMATLATAEVRMPPARLATMT